MAQPRPVLVNQNTPVSTSQQVPQQVHTCVASNAAVNAGDGAGPPVVDLLQIYPGKTNNLAIGCFVDENLLESQPLCCSSCDMCNLRLRNYEEFMVGLLAGICIILFLSILVLIGELSAWRSSLYVYHYFFVITPSLSLLMGKMFVFWRFMLFRREKNTNSFEYHRFGKLFYYSFYGDTTYSLYVASLWILILVHLCFFEGLIYGDNLCTILTSFEESVIAATATWLVAIPIFIYGIIGYFLVYRMGGYNDNRDQGSLPSSSSPSDFESYYTNWAFRKYDNTNDVKYMVNYHYTTNKPQTNTILCRTISGGCNDCKEMDNNNNDNNNNSNEIRRCCIGNDDPCRCCNTCDGVNTCCCCGADCCDDAIKCSLLSIGVWQMIVSSGGLLFLASFVFWFIWSIGAGSAWAVLYALFSLLCFFGVTGFHLTAAWYGCALVNYRFKCCKYGSEATEDSDIRFYDLSLKALRAYSALAAYYYYGFAAYITYFAIRSLVWYFNFGVFISIFIIAFFCWLPFEALKLIDTFIKMENYKRKNTPNVVSMVMIEIKNGKNNVSTGVNNTDSNNNGETDNVPANSNNAPKEGLPAV